MNPNTYRARNAVALDNNLSTNRVMAVASGVAVEAHTRMCPTPCFA